jgi:hypothetical protein
MDNELSGALLGDCLISSACIEMVIGKERVCNERLEVLVVCGCGDGKSRLDKLDGQDSD